MDPPGSRARFPIRKGSLKRISADLAVSNWYRSYSLRRDSASLCTRTLSSIQYPVTRCVVKLCESMWMRLVCTPVYGMRQQRRNCRFSIATFKPWITADKPSSTSSTPCSLDPSFLFYKLKDPDRDGNSGWTLPLLLLYLFLLPPPVIDPNSMPRRVHRVYKPQPRNDISPISARCFALEYGLDVLPTIYAPRIFGTFRYSEGIKCFVGGFWFI